MEPATPLEKTCAFWSPQKPLGNGAREHKQRRMKPKTSIGVTCRQMWLELSIIVGAQLLPNIRYPAAFGEAVHRYMYEQKHGRSHSDSDEESLPDTTLTDDWEDAGLMECCKMLAVPCKRMPF
eukprot:15256425-Alexandrium_andersonii.AAC.1